MASAREPCRAQAAGRPSTEPYRRLRGEHDNLDDVPGKFYLDRYGKNAKGSGWYSFNQNGVHFIGLVPNTSAANWRSISAWATVSIGPKLKTPALLTTMSGVPNAASATSKSLRTSSTFDTSPWTETARPPAAVIASTVRSAASRLVA